MRRLWRRHSPPSQGAEALADVHARADRSIQAAEQLQEIKRRNRFAERIALVYQGEV